MNLLFRLFIYSTYLFMTFVTFNDIYPSILFRHQYATLPEFSQWVGQMTEPDAVIITSDEGLFINHYSKRKTLPHPVSESDFSNSSLLAYKKTLDTYLDQNIPLYATNSMTSHDFDNKFIPFMTKNYNLQYIGTHLYEDWHSSPIMEQIIYNHLYKITKKNNRQ